MKADHKTILILLVAIIDCVLGGVILYSRNIENKQLDGDNKESIVKEEETTIKLLALNDIFVNAESELLASVQVEEEEEEPEPEIVYDGMTLDELSAKLNRYLKNELKGKGELIASYSLKKGVDPYIATAIMMHETGCKWSCSRIMRECNNVGGKKGSGCGSYQYYDTLDEGIKKLISYLSKNYFKKGLDTPKEINKKYATDKTWYKKINKYVKEIKAA